MAQLLVVTLGDGGDGVGGGRGGGHGRGHGRGRGRHRTRHGGQRSDECVREGDDTGEKQNGAAAVVLVLDQREVDEAFSRSLEPLRDLVRGPSF